MFRNMGRIAGTLVLVCVLATVCVAAEAPRLHVPEDRHEFESVVEGVAVTHDFVIRNQGTADLNIERVRAG